MKVRILVMRMVRQLAFTPKGLVWLPTFSLLLSALIYLFTTNTILSLMDQKTMIFMTAQVVLLSGTLAVAIVGADAVAGERDRGTLESVLAAPITRAELLIAYLCGSLIPWAAMVLVALPYLAVVCAGTGGFLMAAATLLGTGSLLAIGVAAWSVGLSAGAESMRNAVLMTLVAYTGLAVPALLASGLRMNWVGRVYDFVDPFSNVLNSLDSVIIDEQGLSLQTIRLLMLGAFSVGGLVYARQRIARLALA